MALDKVLRAETARALYHRTIGLVSVIILVFTVMTLLIGSGRLFYEVLAILQADGITGNYITLFTDVLTLFILIELTKSLFDYFDSGKIYVPIIVDVGTVFVIRHLMIELFHHKLESSDLVAIALLLLALGVLRVATTYSFSRATSDTALVETDK